MKRQLMLGMAAAAVLGATVGTATDALGGPGPAPKASAGLKLSEYSGTVGFVEGGRASSSAKCAAGEVAVHGDVTVVAEGGPIEYLNDEAVEHDSEWLVTVKGPAAGSVVAHVVCTPGSVVHEDG